MDDDITISTLSDYAITDTVTIDTSLFSSLNSNSILGPYPSYNIGAVGSSAGTYYANNIAGNSLAGITFSSTNNPGSMQVKGDAEFEGDVKIKGVSIAKALDDIQKRLAILVPNPAKLEHFEALKKAYHHYKTLEALCELPIQENKE